ncbi:MAG: PepSY-associated TM helix domain-containing protein, partial [bacterium]|nr:PepSY-associated TM helix domain-containing protein [bacterium]
DEGFQFFMGRPGREYDVYLNTETGHARVEVTNKGLLGILRGLHGLRNMPGSTWWSPTWSVYSEISIWALIFSVLSGIYFWWVRVPERRMGWWLLGVGSGGSILFMLYMVL